MAYVSRNSNNSDSISANKLRSTPQSFESAARGKDTSVTGLGVDVVGPWMARDIENSECCEVDRMLKTLLLDCMDETNVANDPAELLETCLESVLPICNGEVSKNNVDSANIKSHLTNYSKAHREIDLYPHFAHAANTALLLLQDLNTTSDFRQPSDQLVFQVYGNETEQSHHKATSTREPDIALVSAADLQVSDVVNDLLKATAKKPQKSFRWRDVRTVIEFKTVTGVQPPPSNYTTGKYTEPPLRCKYLVSKLSSSKDARSQTEERTEKQPVSGTSQVPMVRKRKAPTHEPENKLRSESGDWSNSVAPDFKRQRVGTSKANLTRMHHATQTGIYGTEMFASHAGREYAICLAIVGDLLYFWRYDRQGLIQCSALNFIQGLPRFLVLLFAMQRFENRHWGLNHSIDPHFGNRPTPVTVHIEDPKQGRVDILLHDRQVSHYGLNGRATNVFSATSPHFLSREKLVAKLFWSEESRMSEPEILERVYAIAIKEMDVLNHVPAMVFSHAFSNTSTATIRKHLCLQQAGSRVLYLIVFKELTPATELAGKSFLQCWWETANCHRALWKNGVYHRDVSPSNLMYYEDDKGNAVGVLNDFDLATVSPSPTGNPCAGTVPFMALDLLTEKGLAGKIEHAYAHDAESFIWVLTWVYLCYDDGVLREDPPLGEWLKVDASGCRKEEHDFLFCYHSEDWTIGRGHEQNWLVAKWCLAALVQQLIPPRQSDGESCDQAFERLLKSPYEKLESRTSGEEEKELGSSTGAGTA